MLEQIAHAAPCQMLCSKWNLMFQYLHRDVKIDGHHFISKSVAPDEAPLSLKWRDPRVEEKRVAVLDMLQNSPAAL